MKITVIGPVYPYRGGIAQYTSALSMELAAAGHEVQTISFIRQYPGWLYPGKSDKDPSAIHTKVPALYPLDPFFFWTWIHTVRQIQSFHPDFVIIQWWTTFWAPAFLFISHSLKQRSVPVAFCIHNVIPHENRPPDVWVSKLVLSRAKGFITLSPKESGRLKKLLPSARVYQSRLPVPSVLHAHFERDTTRNRIGISAEQPVLLFFGIVRPYKGLAVLLDALDILKQVNVRPFLIIAGEFWENAKEYLDKIENLGLTGQVRLENRYVPDEELSQFFAAADVFVAPYIKGTQSAAIKMAMSHGLPILASDQISGDLPVDSFPIYVHKAGNANDLAQSIQRFIEQNIPGSRVPVKGDDWPEIVALFEKAADELSQGK